MAKNAEEQQLRAAFERWRRADERGVPTFTEVLSRRRSAGQRSRWRWRRVSLAAGVLAVVVAVCFVPTSRTVPSPFASAAPAVAQPPLTAEDAALFYRPSPTDVLLAAPGDPAGRFVRPRPAQSISSE